MPLKIAVFYLEKEREIWSFRLEPKNTRYNDDPFDELSGVFNIRVVVTFKFHYFEVQGFHRVFN